MLLPISCFLFLLPRDVGVIGLSYIHLKCNLFLLCVFGKMTSVQIMSAEKESWKELAFSL